ncbi:MAG: hypothetical protein VB035_06220 [Candidatus Fimivivens sp.]|nr:hypothetical protein [Candidatus Fimivivens sp.]
MKQAIISLADGSMTTGKVSNIIEITQEAALGFILPDNTLMWDCGQYPVAIGDDWNDGVFTRAGKALTPVPTVEQQLAETKAQLAQADAAAVELFEGQLALQSQLDAALIEMYEAKAN